MKNQVIHILNQMGVITSFSVAKKITEEDIHKFFTKGKKDGKSKCEIEKQLETKILNEIQTAVIKMEIPGLIGPQELAMDMAKEIGLSKEIIENLPELNRLIMIIAHKLMEKKYNKMSLCYFINSMVNFLSLEESDFEKFHRQNQSDDNDDDEE